MIKFLVMDVDGTLTDGKINMSASGELFKSFNIKDGYGIKNILPALNITPIVITGRNSEIVTNRCKELDIDTVFQGVSDKLSALKKILVFFSDKDSQRYNLSNVAYCGDDLNDIACMKAIKDAGGAVFCPHNAVNEVKDLSSYISDKNGGSGAVRDIIDFLANKNAIDHEALSKKIEYAIKYIKKVDLKKLSVGFYEVNDFLTNNVSEYKTKEYSEVRFESHRKCVDIQWLISGKERICLANTNILTADSEYDKNKDVIFWKNPENYYEVFLNAGSYAVFLPENAHKPSLMDTESVHVKKLVAKIKI